MPTETFFKQELFNTHFKEANHNVGNDLKGRLIDQTHDLEERKKREHFWQDELYFFESNDYKVSLLFCDFSTQTFKMVFTRKLRDAFMVNFFSWNFQVNYCSYWELLFSDSFWKFFNLAKCHELSFVSCSAEKWSTMHELFCDFLTIPVTEKKTYKNLLVTIY